MNTRCGFCHATDHRDRWDKSGRAVCPKRRAEDARWKRREARARRKAGIPAGPCYFCGEEPKQVKIITSDSRINGKWAGEKCAVMFEQLSRALGGNPRRMPLMRTIDGGKG